MSEAVEQFLVAFDRLSETERHEALLEIMKRAQAFGGPDLDGETLAQIADELWQIYDAEEAADGHPTRTE